MRPGTYTPNIPYRYLVVLLDEGGTLIAHKVSSAKFGLEKVLPGEKGQTRRVYRLLSSRRVAKRRAAEEESHP